MQAWFFQLAHKIRYSYWFIPSLMCFLAIVLSVSLVALDMGYNYDIPYQLEWLFASEPSGARAVLSTIAGSMITVAGVVFSMTIMSLSHATSNYGSRLLLQFLEDTRNQVTLGAFTATFVYCLLVLRTVSGSDGADDMVFVPHFAILAAIVFALASVALLIVFIHHVPTSIHVGTLTHQRGRELTKHLAALFPEHEDTSGISLNSFTPELALAAPTAGYLQSVDRNGLANFAKEHNCLVKLHIEPGDYVLSGQNVVELMFEEHHDDNVEIQELLDLFSYLNIGNQRTPKEDARYYIDELQQICLRALSPGINDPFTAASCIDWMANSIASVANKHPADHCVRDDNEKLRLIQKPLDSLRVADWVLNPLRQHVTKDFMTMELLLGHVRDICGLCQRAELQTHLVNHAIEIINASEKQFSNTIEQQRLAQWRAKFESF